MSKNLVIVRAGLKSTHLNWLKGEKPGFDLLVAAYQELPEAMLQGAAETLLLPGKKVEGWYALLSQRPEILERYDQIALLDDDLICTATEINQTFSFGRKYGLSLWQPSLTWDSYFSYAVFLHNPLYSLRFVNFIEMMCPFFSSAHLKEALPLFSCGYETGIDRLWCRLRDNGENAYAVVDAVQILHSRPVGKNRKDQGFVGADSNYQTVIDRFEAATGVYFRGPVAYAGVSRSGKRLKGRPGMALRAVVLLLAAGKTANAGWFYRPVTDHIRHILTRPVATGRIALEKIIPGKEGCP